MKHEPQIKYISDFPCAKCGGLERFYPRPGRKNGRCTVCTKAVQDAYLEKKKSEGIKVKKSPVDKTIVEVTGNPLNGLLDNYLKRAW